MKPCLQLWNSQIVEMTSQIIIKLGFLVFEPDGLIHNTYIHTLLHSSPLEALLPYMNIKISSYKAKEKNLQIKI